MDAGKGSSKGGKGPVQSKSFEGKPHLTCPVKVKCYAHIAVAVTDEAGALEFYAKFGFLEKARKSNICILSNPNTEEKFEIHLLLQPDVTYTGPYGKDTGINALMDMDDKKLPGHTHISFNVPSLPLTKEYLSVCTVHISGERGNAAVFVRDVDRNVVELQGPMVGPESALQPASVLVSVNHIGIRVVDPFVSAKWYSKVLGFGERIMWYEPDKTNPKSNGSPWVILNENRQEINILLNTPAMPPCNVLLEGPMSAGLCPGIVYPAYLLENFEESVKFLEANGIELFDDDVAAEKLQLGSRFCPQPRSKFLTDPDGSVIRIIG